MKWANDLTPGEVTGKQTLTDAKPITRIHRAVQEIQNLAVTAAAMTINGTPLRCSVSGNKLDVSGEIPVGDAHGSDLPDGTAENQVLVWTGSEWIADFVRAI